MKASPQEKLWQREISHPEVEEDETGPGKAVESPWPGTLWVHPATAAFPVEWLVVDQGLRPPLQCLLIPADCHPVLGITDVAISNDQLGGPLSVRCHLGRWVSPSLLERAQYSGQIASQMLDSIQIRHRTVVSDSEEVMLGADGGLSPEYEDWIAEVRRAWDTLIANSAPLDASTQPAAPRYSLFVANALLVLGLGIGSVWYHGRQISSRSLSESTIPNTVTLENLPSGSGLPSNFPRVVFQTATTRGPTDSMELLLPTEAEQVLIQVMLKPEHQCSKFRLMVHDLTLDREAWRANELQAQDDGRGFMLSTVVASSALLPGNRYRIQLDGYRDPSWLTVSRHALQVK